ncbi:unnamed protein product, partial [Tenebrio molitor]
FYEVYACIHAYATLPHTIGSRPWIIKQLPRKRTTDANYILRILTKNCVVIQRG